jgi:structural maintenance of chromosome 2
MHIKEIIIDGFKSYANKTSILGLDRHFNAITGFNGSGKSNIFDALCFVMGISSLANVRAANLQDLIYKKGLAGVDKASVTVIFENSDKNNSPVGYEEYDEITVCRMIYQGKSKYILNGYSSTQEKVRDLFLSVQLNINNPHFLVMQGKVRQVVNMKPIEILGLMEEAAGTSSFQLKKESSLKIIKKKQNKLDEIDKMLAEEITPKIEQLDKDKQNFQKWKTTQNEIIRMDKIIKAYNYYSHTKDTEIKVNEVAQFKSQRDEMQGDYNKMLKDLEALNKKFAELVSNKKNKFQNSLSDLENKKNGKNKDLNVEKNKLDLMKDNLLGANKKIEQLNRNKDEKNIKLENLNKKKVDLENNSKMLQNEFQHQKEFINQLEISLENMKAGKKDTNIISNIQLITDAENNKKNAKIEHDQLFEQIKILSNENKDKKVKLSEMKIKLKDSESKYNSFQKLIDNVKKVLNQLGENQNNKNMFDAIQKNISDKQAELSRYERQQNEILSKCNQRVEIQYRDPEPNFNKKKIYGRVIKNFRVKDPKYIRALEKAAGGKLYNVIVDNHKTASVLFQRKCFDYMVTLLPLDKVYSKPITEDKIESVNNISKGGAVLALDLIEYNKDVEPAMKFVFGNVLVCNTSQIAEEIAFGKIKIKCVNLEGDVYDPNGILSGGANFSGQPIIKLVAELREVQEKIENINDEIKELKDKLSAMGENQKKINENQKKLDELNKKQNEFNKDLINKEISNIENELNKYDQEIKAKEARIEYLEKISKKYSEELTRLKKEEQELNNVANNSAKKESLYEKKIEEINKNNNLLKKNIDKTNKEIDQNDYQIQNIKKEIKQLDEDISNENREIESVKSELSSQENKVQKIENEIKKIMVEIYNKETESMKDEKEIREIQSKKDRLENDTNNYKSDLKILEDKIRKYDQDISDSETYIKKLQKENEWIESEMNFFGMKGTDYDFSKLNIKEEYKKLEKLKEDNSILKRKVNMKVESMADQYDKEYSNLIKKKDIIFKDKLNIQRAIEDLDKKRKEALEKVFSLASESLNKIYKTLLPGTMAKLEQIDKYDLMKGVHLRVAFNGVWKKSLAELSGGQSSLLALSLILALLRYKPAPIYIFDEIDAALDLSHTANLGLMLKQEFPESQFVVISLKDGMFSNANVLYRVSYVDGSSKVERLTKSTL